MGGRQALRFQFMGCGPGLDKIERIRLGKERHGKKKV
jgi:hypothetical protein